MRTLRTPRPYLRTPFSGTGHGQRVAGMKADKANAQAFVKNPGSFMQGMNTGRPSTQIKTSTIPHYKKGGTVKKTGPAIVHKGEKVIPANKRKAVENMLKKHGGIGRNY